MEDLEKKVEKLEERIKVLEKTEKRRKRAKIATILVKVFIFSVILVTLWYGYNYVNDKYIKPYKGKIDSIEEKFDTLKKLNINGLFK